jgi:uncharacterized membrane protein
MPEWVQNVIAVVLAVALVWGLYYGSILRDRRKFHKALEAFLKENVRQ